MADSLIIDASTRNQAAPSSPAPSSATGSNPAALRAAAEEFEAVFIAEMLSHAGADQARSAYGGGFAEESFKSMLAGEWGGAIARSGGVGLADRIFESLKGRTNV